MFNSLSERLFVHIQLIFLLCIIVVGVSGCKDKVLKSIPANGSLEHGTEVYVENDGRCPEEQVLKITGGSRKRGIRRIYECTERP